MLGEMVRHSIEVDRQLRMAKEKDRRECEIIRSRLDLVSRVEFDSDEEYETYCNQQINKLEKIQLKWLRRN